MSSIFRKKRVVPVAQELPEVQAREQFKGITYQNARSEDGVNVSVFIDSRQDQTSLTFETIGDFYYGNKAVTDRISTSTPEVQAGVREALSKSIEHYPRLRHNFSQFHALADFIEPLYVLHAQLVGNTYHCAYTHGGRRQVKEGLSTAPHYAAIMDNDSGAIGKVFGDVREFEITARMALPEINRNHQEPVGKVPLVEFVGNVKRPAVAGLHERVTLYGSESDGENFNDRTMRLNVYVPSGRVEVDEKPGKKRLVSVSTGICSDRRNSFWEVSPWYGPLPMLTDLLQVAYQRVGSLAKSNSMMGGLNAINEDNIPRFAYEVTLKHPQV